MSLVFEHTILMKKFIQKSFAFSFFKTGLQGKDFFKCSNSLKNKLITILDAGYRSIYSYRRASIGLRRPAFNAG